MLIDLILNGLSSFVLFIINLFPVIHLPQGIENGIQGFTNILSIASAIFPVQDFIICLGIVLSFYGTRFVISILNWLISKIPTIS